MSKYFDKRGQNVNGFWKPKKRRLPRKMKKWIKQLDKKRFLECKSRYFKPISSYQQLLNYRSTRYYRFGNFYYKQVFKY